MQGGGRHGDRGRHSYDGARSRGVGPEPAATSAAPVALHPGALRPGNDRALPGPVRHVLRGAARLLDRPQSLRSPLTNAFTGLLNYRTVFTNGEYWSGVVRMGYFGAVQVTS